MRLYVLDDQGEPLRCDDLEVWAHWMERSIEERIVQYDYDDAVTVSTVFLGLDHNHFGVGAPILWETMVFGGLQHHECHRYTSRAAALAGHAEVWSRVRAAL